MITIKEHEVAQNYALLRKAIRRGDPKAAVAITVGLLAGHASELWAFLRQSSSSDVSHTDGHAAVLVKTLFDNWTLDQNPAFIVHAVLALTDAPKGTSAMDYLSRRSD